MVVWKASRGFGGKSTLLSVLALTEAFFFGVPVVVLGGSGGQSQLCQQTILKKASDPLVDKSLFAADPSERHLKLTNGGSVTPLKASQTSVRGPHPVRLRLDEIDEMKLDIHDASLGQPMSAKGFRGQVVQSSTHQYPDATMSEVIKRARKAGHPVMEWCYRESHVDNGGWLTQAEIDFKRTQFTDAMWNVEVELQEPSPEGRAIKPECVNAAYNPEWGEYAGVEGDIVIIEEPEPDALYYAGADWGKRRDKTMIRIFKDCKDHWREVAFAHLARRPWPVMVQAYDRLVTKYQAISAHDATGLGDVISDYMETWALNVELRGVFRTNLFADYIAAIENGWMRSPRIQSFHAEHLYVTWDDLHGKGHPPDSFIAGALAYHARTRKSEADVDSIVRNAFTANRDDASRDPRY